MALECQKAIVNSARYFFFGSAIYHSRGQRTWRAMKAEIVNVGDPAGSHLG